MSALNPFFEIEEGIQLSGFLKKGSAMMTLVSGHLSGMLTAEYNDIQFKFKPTSDRGI